MASLGSVSHSSKYLGCLANPSLKTDAEDIGVLGQPISHPITNGSADVSQSHSHLFSLSISNTSFRGSLGDVAGDRSMCEPRPGELINTEGAKWDRNVAVENMQQSNNRLENVLHWGSLGWSLPWVPKFPCH